MKKDQTVQLVKLVTPGQMKEIISAAVEGIPANMSFDTAQYLIGKKKKLGTEIRKIFTFKNSYAEFVIGRENFYRNVFGIECDFSNVIIPERPGNDWRLRIMIDMKLEQLYAKCKELFPCWRRTNDNLDEIVTWNERDAKNGPYAIWVRDRVEADEELQNLSANKIKEMNLKTETLTERLIDELEFFNETKGHLDIKNITLCAGSRYGDGDVPCVDWDVGRLRVYGPDVSYARGALRSRQAVS